MPGDYEMMVAASPPVFSHSPPASSFLATNYNYLRYGPASFNRNSFNNNIINNNNNQQHSSPPRKIVPDLVKSPNCRQSAQAAAVLSAVSMVPRRPCLVVRAVEDAGGDAAASSETSSGHSVSSGTNGVTSNSSRSKKKVVFADDKGLSLTQVRVMSEPSSCPPCWTREFLAQVTKGISAEVAPEPWEVTFPQPASDYLEFRKRLDSENVSLENVIVKEADELIIGTVKVCNLSFHKEVFVRLSFDDWVTHEDAFCTFVPNNPVSFGGTTGASGAASSYVLYDTFSFRIPLKPRSNKVEFCVCFRSGDNEYWDNNGGKNYVLVKQSPPPPPTKIPIVKNNNAVKNGQNQQQQRFHDALRAKLDSWSEFASWNHLVNDGPYW